jgi:trk system potassium uptake protein TrkA
MANPKKHFFVLGLGTFGGALAVRLAKNGCRVTGVDIDQNLVEALKEELYEAVVANVADRAAIEQLGLAEADAVFVSLGEDLAPSLLATLHAKEVGAQRIIAKGLTVAHGRILEALGVERIVFPEIEIARSVADQMTWPNVLDYVPIDPEHSVVEMTVPDSIMGETLLEADLRKRFNIWVIGVKDVLTGKFHMLPGPDLRFNDNQLLVLMGKKDDLNRLREFK